MAGTVQTRTLAEDYGPDSGGRQKNVTIVKPILIGCRSKRLPKPIPNPNPNIGQTNPNQTAQEHSHTWKLYVRPYHNEDISVWIKRVQFKLHDTYPNNTRSITSAPFEVEETGWGEFEVQVKIHFVDPNERQVTLWTWVRLFKKDTEHHLFYLPDGTLVGEYYDEVVFVEPSLMMMDYLNVNKMWAADYKPEVNYEEKRKETIKNIRKARDRITPEIQALSSQFEAFKNAYAGIMAVLRGEPQPAFSDINESSQLGSEYGGESVATSSQGSVEQTTMD